MRALTATLTLTAALLAGCGSRDVPVKVTADIGPSGAVATVGQPCSSPAVSVVVARDGKGTIVGKGNLTGKWATPLPGTVRSLCLMSTTVPLDDADFYTFEVPGYATSAPMSADEVEKVGAVTLTVDVGT